MKQIKNILSHFSTFSRKEQQWKYSLMESWESIMGSLSSKVSIYKIYDKTIILGVYDSNWMQELYLLSELIKTKLNTYLKVDQIQTIRFRYIIEKKESTTEKKEVTPSKISTRPLSTREKKALEKIEDQELSEALKGFLQKCHQSS